MGYDLHITRADEWLESDQYPITREEWIALVAADPELKFDEPNDPHFAVWPGPCSYPDGTWFDWSEGRISTKNPDQAILAKLLQMATLLQAKVQGDDGECYTHCNQAPTGYSVPKRPWWKFW